MFDPKSVSEKYIGRYYIMEELASSSSSRIFLAKQNPSLPLPLVVKLFYSVRIDTLQDEARFLAEIRLHRQLQHPFILPTMDSGADKRTPYIVMPYLPSGSLHDRMLRRLADPLSLENILTILSQIGQALYYAHQNHIFHGNLKPRNILLHTDGYVQLSDFTCRTIQSTFHNNPDTMLYMAPEQLNGTMNALSDQYALGCLAYELFTGQVFPRPSFPHKNYQEAPSTLSHNLLLPHIEQAILKATAPKPEQRYPNAHAFINALTALNPVVALAPSAATSTPPDISTLPTPPTTHEGMPLTLSMLLASPANAPKQDTTQPLPIENSVPSLITEATISKQATIPHATIPQAPIVLTGTNNTIVTSPPPQPQKQGVQKPLFLIIASIIIVILIGNLIASFQLLTHSTQNSPHPAATASVFQQSNIARVATQPPPTLPSTTNNQTTPAPSHINTTPTPQTLPTTTAFNSTSDPPPPSFKTTNLFKASPTHLSTSNCERDNSNYRCTVMLYYNLQGQLNWQASSIGFAANFSTPNGVLAANQTIQVIIYIPAICPNNGTLFFWGAGIGTTATWHC